MDRLEYRYRASVARVFELLIDPEFLRRRRQAAGDTDVSIDVQRHGELTTVRLTSMVAADLPAFARKLFSRLIRVVGVDEWERSGEGWRSRYQVQVAGGVGVVRGELQLSPDGDSAMQRDQFEIEVRFPLFRERLRRLMVAEALKAMTDESLFLESELARGSKSTLGAG